MKLTPLIWPSLSTSQESIGNSLLFVSWKIALALAP